MTQILSLITAFGLGSIVTALIQSWLAQRAMKGERSFREKQAAYVGLLEAYHAQLWKAPTKLLSYSPIGRCVASSSHPPTFVTRYVES